MSNQDTIVTFVDTRLFPCFEQDQVPVAPQTPRDQMTEVLGDNSQHSRALKRNVAVQLEKRGRYSDGKNKKFPSSSSRRKATTPALTSLFQIDEVHTTKRSVIDPSNDTAADKTAESDQDDEVVLPPSLPSLDELPPQHEVKPRAKSYGRLRSMTMGRSVSRKARRETTTAVPTREGKDKKRMGTMPSRKGIVSAAKNRTSGLYNTISRRKKSTKPTKDKQTADPKPSTPKKKHTSVSERKERPQTWKRGYSSVSGDISRLNLDDPFAPTATATATTTSTTTPTATAVTGTTTAHPAWVGNLFQEPVSDD